MNELKKKERVEDESFDSRVSSFVDMSFSTSRKDIHQNRLQGDSRKITLIFPSLMKRYISTYTTRYIAKVEDFSSLTATISVHTSNEGTNVESRKV